MVNVYKLSWEEYKELSDELDGHVLTKWIDFRHKDYEGIRHRVYYGSVVTDTIGQEISLKELKENKC